MSAAGVSLRELQASDLSAPLVEADGLVYLAGVPLPAVFHSEALQDDDEFMRFCHENEPLDFERYPGGEIVVMAPAGRSRPLSIGQNGNRKRFLLSNSWTERGR